MINKVFEKKVIDHIESEIKNSQLKSFLLKLIASRIKNRNLLCLCILIDIRYDLLKETDYVAIITTIKPLNFSQFVKSFVYDFKKGIYTNISFSCEFSGHRCFARESYSRILDLDSFEAYVAGIAHDVKKLKFKDNLHIDKKQIKKEGWSGGNGTVWITPTDLIEMVLVDTDGDEYKANKICDYVGFPRTKKLFTMHSSINPGHYVMINYSEDFNAEVYQPNSTNAKFENPEMLFISYNKDDGFGLTYNENYPEFAQEQIHQKTKFIDDKFKAVYVGQISIDKKFSRKGILSQAMKRLNI